MDKLYFKGSYLFQVYIAIAKLHIIQICKLSQYTGYA
jgi:hypothetical protein